MKWHPLLITIPAEDSNLRVKIWRRRQKLGALNLKNGAIVHDIDFKDQAFNHPETSGLGLMVRSIRRLQRDDHVFLEQGHRVLDTVYGGLSLLSGEGYGVA